MTNDGEIAALKEAVEYREPGRQAVCASTCSALIKVRCASWGWAGVLCGR